MRRSCTSSKCFFFFFLSLDAAVKRLVGFVESVQCNQIEVHESQLPVQAHRKAYKAGSLTDVATGEKPRGAPEPLFQLRPAFRA